MALADALAHLDRGSGEAVTAYISPSDIKDALTQTYTDQNAGDSASSAYTDNALVTAKSYADTKAAAAVTSATAAAATAATAYTNSEVAKHNGGGDFTVARVTGTHTDIQLQLDAAEAAGGGTVWLPGGTWLINSSLLISSDVTLTCSSNAIIRRNSSVINNIIRNKSDGSVGGFTASHDITISGGVWDGNKALATNVTVMGFGHCTDLLVENADVSGIFGWHGIEYNSTLRGIVRNCTFHDYLAGSEFIQLDIAASSGAFPWFGPFDNTPCEDILITGNTFRIGGYGIGTHLSRAGVRHTMIRVTDNHFDTCSIAGIAMQDWQHVVVSGNTFDNCGIATTASTGINQLCYGYTMTGNVVNNCGTRGFYFDGVNMSRYMERISISDNVMQNIGSYGIGCDYCVGVTLSGNVITGASSFGIWIYGTAEAVLTGNYLVGNNTNSGATAGDLGIGNNNAAAVTETPDITISGNTVGNIRIYTGTRILITGNIIRFGYAVGGASAPVPTLVYRSANMIAGVYAAT